MRFIKEHIIFKLITLTLVITILAPSIVKLEHAFENHAHDFCTDNYKQTHLHALDIECEFYKFKINNPFTFRVHSLEFHTIENNHKVFTSQYQFISEYQRLSFALRGPPLFV